MNVESIAVDQILLKRCSYVDIVIATTVDQSMVQLARDTEAQGHHLALPEKTSLLQAVFSEVSSVAVMEIDDEGHLQGARRRRVSSRLAMAPHRPM
jgi:hypothetical protein